MTGDLELNSGLFNFGRGLLQNCIRAKVSSVSDPDPGISSCSLPSEELLISAVDDLELVEGGFC